jgi:hypothetical protein
MIIDCCLVLIASEHIEEVVDDVRNSRKRPSKVVSAATLHNDNEQTHKTENISKLYYDNLTNSSIVKSNRVGLPRDPPTRQQQQLRAHMASLDVVQESTMMMKPQIVNLPTASFYFLNKLHDKANNQSSNPSLSSANVTIASTVTSNIQSNGGTTSNVSEDANKSNVVLACDDKNTIIENKSNVIHAFPIVSNSYNYT